MRRTAPAPAPALQLHGYVPGLDILRGLAVGAVVLFHAFFNANYHGRRGSPGELFVELTNLGKLGVYLFFVLSGFLITSILLKQRERPRFYRNFYVRRALRILPAYLLLLFVLKVSGLISWPFVLACLLFVANVARLVHAHTYEYGALWTLAVEEQFYLLWPTFVHRLRRPRALLPVLLAGCVLAPLLRAVFSYMGVSTYTWLPTNMDALLYGALCAVLIHEGAIHGGNIARIRRVLLVTGLVFLLPYVYESCYGPWFSRGGAAVWEAFSLFDPFCFFVAGVLLSVERAQASQSRRPGAFGASLAFLGYISYGLYLVHPLIFSIYDKLVAGRLLGGYPHEFSLLVLRGAVVAGCSVGIATVSRRYFEQLFLRRKKEMAPYVGATAQTESLP